MAGTRTYTRQPVRRPFGFLLQIVQTLVLTIVVYAALQAFVAQPYRVVQGSMRDTLQEGQSILIDKLTPRFDPYRRGDIVVFRPPATAAEADDTPYIKRVIGIPEDRLVIRDGRVWVNGSPLDESEYVYAGEPTYAFDQRLTSWEVPADSLFVLGDHRTNSSDSRTARIGFIPVEDVLGRAFLRYWPIGSLALLDTPEYPQLTVGAGDASIEVP
jgi:signal peptidase I